MRLSTIPVTCGRPVKGPVTDTDEKNICVIQVAHRTHVRNKTRYIRLSMSIHLLHLTLLNALICPWNGWEDRHCDFPDNKIHGANMGPNWVLSAPGGPPCWPHEPCYQGSYIATGLCLCRLLLHMAVKAITSWRPFGFKCRDKQWPPNDETVL